MATKTTKRGSTRKKPSEAERLIPYEISLLHKMLNDVGTKTVPKERMARVMYAAALVVKQFDTLIREASGKSGVFLHPDADSAAPVISKLLYSVDQYKKTKRPPASLASDVADLDGVGRAIFSVLYEVVVRDTEHADGVILASDPSPSGEEGAMHIPAQGYQTFTENMPDNRTKMRAAATETTKSYVPPKRQGKKSVGSAWVDPHIAEGLTAIAAAHGMRPTDYLSKMVTSHVETNPKLVEKGRAMMGAPIPYRTTRMEQEEEIRRLNEKIARLTKTPQH